MASFNKFEVFSEHLAEKVHDLNADQLDVYLSNATPSASGDSFKADLAEITNQNGYTAPMDTGNSTSRTGGTTSVVSADTSVVTATGAVGPFQYVVLMNQTVSSPSADALIGWWDYGTPVTLANGETFTVDYGTSLLTIA